MKVVLVLATLLLISISISMLQNYQATPRFSCTEPIDLSAARESRSSSFSGTIQEDYLTEHRSLLRSFKTVPEWYIVFNAREYAAHLDTKFPSSFRSYDANAQYWQLYDCMDTHVGDRLSSSVNPDMETILQVIGVSFSIENSMRATYERSMGRLTEFTVSEPTAVDAFSADVAQSYADLLNTKAWYTFDFITPLKKLWQVPVRVSTGIRGIERKLALSSEYLFKSGYAQLIGLSDQGLDEDVTAMTTTVLVESTRDELAAVEEDIEILQEVDETHLLISVPRYQPLRAAMLELIAAEVQPVLIENYAVVVVSGFVAPDMPREAVPGQELFRMEYLSDTAVERRGWLVPVKELAAFVEALTSADGEVEHFFDY